MEIVSEFNSQDYLEILFYSSFRNRVMDLLYAFGDKVLVSACRVRLGRVRGRPPHNVEYIFLYFGRPLTLPSRTPQADIHRKSGNFILNTLLLKTRIICFSPIPKTFLTPSPYPPSHIKSKNFLFKLLFYIFCCTFASTFIRYPSFLAQMAE